MTIAFLTRLVIANNLKQSKVLKSLIIFYQTLAKFMVSNHPFANKINPKTVDLARNQKNTEKSSERGLVNRLDGVWNHITSKHIRWRNWFDKGGSLLLDSIQTTTYLWLDQQEDIFLPLEMVSFCGDRELTVAHVARHGLINLQTSWC